MALASVDEVNQAVQAARNAFPEWSNFSPLKRARIMDKFKNLLWDNADIIAKIISAEHGKTHDDALGELTRSIEVVEFSTAIPYLLKSDFTDQVGTKYG